MTELFNDLAPGDIVNFQVPQLDIHDLVTSGEDWFADKVIQKTSMEVFCQKLSSHTVNFLDHHSELWFGPTNVFSMEPPRALWKTQTDLDNDTEDKIISVYRFNPDFWGRELTADDVDIMFKAAETIIQSKQAYSIGQLLNMLCNTIAGIPDYDTYRIFANGDKRLVCSVAVTAVIYNWINTRKTAGEILPVPYSKLNPKAWHDDFIKNFTPPWPIECIFPCHPAVSKTHFGGEFNLIGKYHMGKRIS